MNFRSIILFWLLVAVCLPASAIASQPLSPAEAKYQQKSPELFDKYMKAKNLISLPGERNEELEEANILLAEIFEADISFAPGYVEFARLIYKTGYRPGQLIVSNFGIRYEVETWEHAEIAIKQALKLEPRYADAYLMLGRIHISKFQNLDAHTALNNAALLGSRSSWLYLYYADILNENNKLKAARLLYQIVIGQEVTDKSAYHQALLELAINYKTSGDYEMADIWFRRAIELKPTPTCLNNYASFLIYRKADFKKAIEIGERSMEIATTEEGKIVLGTAYYARWALVKELSGESEAQPLFDKAHEIFPELLTAMGNLSRFPKTREISRILDKKVRQMIEQGKPKKKA